MEQSVISPALAGSCGFVGNQRRVSLGRAPAAVEGRSARFGSSQVEPRSIRRAETLSLTVSEATVGLVAVLAGNVGCTKAEGSRRSVDAPALLVLARPGRSTFSSPAGATLAVLHLARPALQIAASQSSGQPLRIAARDATIAVAHDPVFALLEALATAFPAEPAGAVERRLDAIEAAVVAALLHRADWARLTVVSKAVQRAVATIVERAEETLDLDRLAAAHGITLRTLRETFSACLGKSLTAFVQETRLHRARESLLSGFDSRPIQQIAEAARFKHSSGFSRAYRRLFGETPTRERALSVKNGPPV